MTNEAKGRGALFSPLGALCVVIFGGLSAGALAEPLAITGATIIDGTGKAPLSDGVVLIDGGRIVAVGRARDVAVPEGARRLDARGKYVIPGLMDAHVHLVYAGLEELVRYEGRYDELVLAPLQTTLKSGVTTVFDTWGPFPDLTRVRNRIKAGEIAGSRIYLCGNALGWDGPLSPDFNGAGVAQVSPEFVTRINGMWEQGTGRKLLWMTPEQVRSIVRDYVKKDIDFLKYAGTSHNIAHFNYPTFSPRVQKAIVEVGHLAGFSVQAHTLSVETLDMAIDAGVDIVAHADNTGPLTPIPPDTLRKLVERGTAVSVRPFRQQHLDRVEELDKLGPPPPSWGEPGFYRSLMKVEKTNQRNMIKAGVRMLFSTDGVSATAAQVEQDPRLARFQLGAAHFDALLALEEDGMKPMEVLRSATAYVAAGYKLKDLGTVEPGKIADLLVLDANPLASARNYRAIHAVIKDGRVIGR